MKAILVDDEPDGIRTLKKMLELHCPQCRRGSHLFQCNRCKTTDSAN